MDIFVKIFFVIRDIKLMLRVNIIIIMALNNAIPVLDAISSTRKTIFVS